MLCSEWDISITCLSARLTPWWAEGFWDLRSEYLQWHGICRTRQGCTTHSLIAAVPPVDQSSWKPSKDGAGGTHGVRLVWRTIGKWWLLRCKVSVSLGMLALRDYLCFSRCLYTHVHTGSSKWTCGFKKKDHMTLGGKSGVGWGGVLVVVVAA